MGIVDDMDEEREASVSSHRDQMLAALARYLQKKRLVNIIRMTAAGYDKPRAVNGAVPDIEAVTLMVGQPVFGAAEECDTYAMEEVRTRLEALSRVQNAAVFLVVPAECYEPAKKYFQSNLPGRNVTVLPYGRK